MEVVWWSGTLNDLNGARLNEVIVYYGAVLKNAATKHLWGLGLPLAL